MNATKQIDNDGQFEFTDSITFRVVEQKIDGVSEVVVQLVNNFFKLAR